MAEKKRKIVAIIFLVVVLVGLVGVFMINPSKSDVESLEIGKSYVRTHSWNEEDPFQKPDIDTIKVIDRKDGFVKYSLKSSLDSSHFLSSEEDLIIRCYKLKLVK